MPRSGLRGFVAFLLLALAQGATVRWMPLGDSITDYGCWRAWIWQRFQEEGYNVDIVGGQKAGEDCNGLAFDRDHEGHPGYQATEIVVQNYLVDWLKKSPADMVTMHLGTVDILRGMLGGAQVLAALDKLVDQMRDSNPAMRIIVRTQRMGSLGYCDVLITAGCPTHSPPRHGQTGPGTQRCDSCVGGAQELDDLSDLGGGPVDQLYECRSVRRHPSGGIGRC